MRIFALAALGLLVITIPAKAQQAQQGLSDSDRFAAGMLSAGNQDSLFGAIGGFMQGYKTGSVAPPPQRPLVVAPYGGQHCQRNCINIGNALSGPMLSCQTYCY
jgi:hypothetical protein